MTGTIRFNKCDTCGAPIIVQGFCGNCRTAEVAAREEEIRAKERADLRSWLGQQAAKADREAKKLGHHHATLAEGKCAAFKEAADRLKPPKVKGHLKRKRAARAVGK